ncbi:hypothetical protein CLFO_15430 [Clostridium formicaceticum]|uniref:Uncharacterized protein n=1 Tax=Clostridium formicaceticum TaxID=1497 RepID=A0AAC9RMT3_9CLOT|nr:hypothetical protein CLFO_15430 [Clostridium formicaceticum]
MRNIYYLFYLILIYLYLYTNINKYLTVSLLIINTVLIVVNRYKQ